MGSWLNYQIQTGSVDDYGPMKPEIAERRNGVRVSAEDGEAVAYAPWKLQKRGRMFVDPGEPLYEGMVVGLHSRDNGLVVNPVKTKQLTNIRAGKDEAILLTPLSATRSNRPSNSAPTTSASSSPRSKGWHRR